MENKFQISDFDLLFHKMFSQTAVGRTNLFSELNEINNHAKAFNANKDIIKVSGFDYIGEENKETLTCLFIEINPDGVKPSDFAESKDRIMAEFGCESKTVCDCEEYKLDGSFNKLKPIVSCRLFLTTETKEVFGRLLGYISHNITPMLIIGTLAERKIIDCAIKLGLKVLKNQSLDALEKVDLRTPSLYTEVRSVSGGGGAKYTPSQDNINGESFVSAYIYRRILKAELKIKSSLKNISNESLEILKNEGYVKDKVTREEWVNYQKALFDYNELLSVYRGIVSEVVGLKQAFKFHLEDYYEEKRKNNKQ